MEAWQEWGYAVIQAVQTYQTPAATLLFKALSFMGEEEFYLLFMPLLYWLADKRVALRFTILFLFSTYLNTFLKEVAAQPRPSAERVTVLLDDPGGGGIPSGHSQNAVVSWGFTAFQRPMPWFRWAMLTLILGISLSRIYLGVHFPHDVLGGWLVGGALLLAYVALAPSVTAWLERQTVPVQMAAGGAVTLLLAMLYT
ncbi:MAG: phosphatase PAP2 family protein, partial [Ardenticatenales bacterium]|nr:phosphatase PAP2 family protein [Ardenticatenales bacterium]